MKNILAPSILGADFGHLADQIAAVEQGGAEYLHLDVMDGAFVPNISFGMPLIASLRPLTGMVFDVHMMVDEPVRYVKDLADCGADLITVHAEACRDLDRTLRQIRSLGLCSGVALNPATPAEAVLHVLDMIDMVLVMTVNPGLGGQKMIPYTLEKVRALRKIAGERGLELNIQVDGGVTLDNIREFLDAGANVIVAGSAVFRGDAGERAAAFMRALGRQEGNV